MTRSAAIVAAYMLAVVQGGAMLRNGKTYGPANHLPPRHASHDAECIAKAEAKRARKAAKRAKRAKQLEAKP